MRLNRNGDIAQGIWNVASINNVPISTPGGGTCWLWDDMVLLSAEYKDLDTGVVTNPVFSWKKDQGLRLLSDSSFRVGGIAAGNSRWMAKTQAGLIGSQRFLGFGVGDISLNGAMACTQAENGVDLLIYPADGVAWTLTTAKVSGYVRLDSTGQYLAYEVAGGIAIHDLHANVPVPVKFRAGSVKPVPIMGADGTLWLMTFADDITALHRASDASVGYEITRGDAFSPDGVPSGPGAICGWSIGPDEAPGECQTLRIPQLGMSMVPLKPGPVEPPAPPVPPPAPPVDVDAIVARVRRALATEGLQSPDGRHAARMQDDGNLVVYAPDKPIWSSKFGPWGTEPPVEPPVEPPPPIDPPGGAVVKWPMLAASSYGAIGDPDFDFEYFGRWLYKHKCTSTRAWVLDASAIGQRDGDGNVIKGSYANGFLPMRQRADGRWDLYDWRQDYFERVQTFVKVMNKWGVWPELTLLNLYPWAQGKQGYPGVPDANLGPFRHNVNGVRWGDPDDRTYGAAPYENDPAQLPDSWLWEFSERLVAAVLAVDGRCILGIGNEFPEKPLHYRVRQMLRAVGWTGEILVNRNSNSPGQYWNMAIGQDFDRLSLHNCLDMGYLDRDHPEEEGTGRPRTMREFWSRADVDLARVVISSDGNGRDPFSHLAGIQQVAVDVLRRGASYEHQTALKYRRFFGNGSLYMSDLEADGKMLDAVNAALGR